jgi:Uma2 family endonuclease
MSVDDLLSMPSDGNRYELVQGELRMMSPAGGRHGRITLKLGRRIGDHVEQHDLGETYAAETGFVLQRNPDTVRAPDVAFVSKSKLVRLVDESGYLPVAPDLIAEVLSPNDRASDVEEKVLAWLAAGVVSVLVVDPQNKLIRDYRSVHEIRTHTEGSIDLTEVIPGFYLDVSDLFR